MQTIKTCGLVAGAVGITAFWVPEIWNYGYLQIFAGQFASFLFGASLMLRTTRAR